MDQVRTILNWLKAQHFWVLSVVIALIGTFCWWSASRAMSATYVKNQQQIKTALDGVLSIKGAPFHPNQAINDRQEEERKKQLESVTKLWEQLYEKQKSGVLKWPPALRKDFADAIEKLQFNDEIPPEFLNRYRDYIDRHFPELPKKINARIIEDPTGVGGAGGFGQGAGKFGDRGEGGPGMIPGMIPDDEDYFCEWVDQLVVRQELDFPESPSKLKVWVTQENLWVYDTLLDVIAKTNQSAGTTRMSNAAVKVIYHLDVGRNAAPFSREPNRLLVRPPVAAAAVPGAEGGVEGPGAGPGPSPLGGSPRGGGEGGMMGPGGGPGTVMSPAQEQEYLMDGRYLDEKGAPIRVGSGATAGGGMEQAPPPDAAATAAAATSEAPPLDPAVLGVGYKRLPIRMVMQMDLRWLPQLITNCANEPLRVEVQEVRINPPGLTGAESGGGGFGGGGGRFGGFGGGEGGFGGGGSGAGGANLFPDLTGIQNFPAQPHVGMVVIQGIIYIFNKPDPKVLDSATATAEQPVAPAP